MLRSWKARVGVVVSALWVLFAWTQFWGNEFLGFGLAPLIIGWGVAWVISAVPKGSRARSQFEEMRADVLRSFPKAGGLNRQEFDWATQMAIFVHMEPRVAILSYLFAINVDPKQRERAAALFAWSSMLYWLIQACPGAQAKENVRACFLFSVKRFSTENLAELWRETDAVCSALETAHKRNDASADPILAIGGVFGKMVGDEKNLAHATFGATQFAAIGKALDQVMREAA